MPGAIIQSLGSSFNTWFSGSTSNPTPVGLNYCRIGMKVCMSKLLLQSQPSFTSLSSVAVQNIREEIYFLDSSVDIRIRF